MEQTVQQVKEQLETAMLGVEKRVKELQTKHGVKDSIAQYWIEALLPRGRALQHQYLIDPQTRDPRLNDRKLVGSGRESVREEILEQIKKEQHDWLVQQPPDRFEALPVDSGLLNIFEGICHLLTIAVQIFVLSYVLVITSILSLHTKVSHCSNG